MSRLMKRFLADDRGATAIEYGLIAALISVAIIAGASLSGNSIGNNFNNVSDTLNAS